jgi:hypothetical protein
MKSSRLLLEIDEEASQTIGDAEPGAEDESHALVEHGTSEVERCQRILRWMLDEHPYMARYLSVFYRHAHRGIPPGW